MQICAFPRDLHSDMMGAVGDQEKESNGGQKVILPAMLKLDHIKDEVNL